MVICSPFLAYCLHCLAFTTPSNLREIYVWIKAAMRRIGHLNSPKAAPPEPSLNFLCPTKLHLFLQTYTFCPLFQSLPIPPHSWPRPPNSLPSPLRSQGLRQLRGFRAVESHRFRWKEIDVCFIIAVSLLPLRTQPMADNYLGRQSQTGGGAIHVARPFQVPDTLIARGQHGPAASQSLVWIPATKSWPKRETQVKTMQGGRQYNLSCQQQCQVHWHLLKGSTDAAAQTRGNTGGNGCDTTPCS